MCVQDEITSLLRVPVPNGVNINDKNNNKSRADGCADAQMFRVRPVSLTPTLREGRGMGEDLWMAKR